MHFIPLPYLDPGSGSFILQIAIAAILAAGVAVRAFWGKISGWLGTKPKKEEDDSEDEQS